MRSILNLTTQAPYAIWQNINGIFSFFQQKTSEIFYDQQPFFIKAQSDVHYRQYQDWCADLRSSLLTVKNELRRENLENVSLAFKDILERKIISPIYFQQCLQGLEQAMRKKFRLPVRYIDEVKKIREQFRNQLKTNQRIAKYYFYQDIVNQIIQLSGRQISTRSFVRQFNYYQELVPAEIYEPIIDLLKLFIEQHFQTPSSFTQDLYLEQTVPNKYYETLITAINNVFSEVEDTLDVKKQERITDENQSHMTTSTFNYLKQHSGVLLTAAVAFSAWTFRTAIQDGVKPWFENGTTSLHSNFPLLAPAIIGLGSYHHSSLISNSITFLSVTAGVTFSFSYVDAQVTDTEGFGAQFNLSSLNGGNGFIFYDDAPNESDYVAAIGAAVSSADINGDGFADLLVGASLTSADDDEYVEFIGRVYVIFGNSTFPSAIQTNSLDGTNGFSINGEFRDGGFGVAVGNGDVNHDGIEDIIVGASDVSYNNNPATGAVYVIFGHQGLFSSSVEVASLNGVNGFKIYGTEAYEYIGASVNSADINADGIDDVIIGVGATYSIASPDLGYVVFGHQGPFNESLVVSELNGINGFTLTGTPSLGSINIVASGDINGDMYTDLFLADNNWDGNASVYIMYGYPGSVSSTFNVTALNGSDGFIVNATTAYYDGDDDVLGSGDINNDGISDLIIGTECSPPEGSFAGCTYVIFGQLDNFPSIVQLTSLNGATGFAIYGAEPRNFLGTSIATGDINGDGIADLIIGADQDSPNSISGAGSVYVVYGHAGQYPASLDISSLINGIDGFKLCGNYSAGAVGYSVSSGDINGDGIDDVIVGAPKAGGDENYPTGAGAVYVVFGQRSSHSNSSNNSNQEILAVTLLGTGACLLVTCIGGAVYLAVKKPWLKKTQTQYQPIEQVEYVLRRDKGHTILDNKYELLTRINRQEAKELLDATGIYVPFDQDKQRIRVPLLGKVSLARDVESKRFIAVKKITGKDQIEHTKQQIALQQELKQEANIIALIDVVEAPGSQGQLKLYQFMPLITFGNGRKFQSYLHELEDNHLKMKLMVHVAHQLLIGINNIHKHAIYHLNINPTNFMLDEKGNLCVIDFDCAVKSVENSLIQSDKGSILYFSPERLAHYRERETTTFDAAKADSWALGVTLLEILINRYPFELNENSDPIQNWDQNFFNQELQKISSLVELQTNSIWSLIKGLLELDANKRCSIAEALVEPIFTHPEYCFHSIEEREKIFLELKQQALRKSLLSETDISMTTFVDNYNNQDDNNNNEMQRQNIYGSDRARFTIFGGKTSTQQDTYDNYNNMTYTSNM